MKKKNIFEGSKPKTHTFGEEEKKKQRQFLYKKVFERVGNVNEPFCVRRDEFKGNSKSKQ